MTANSTKSTLTTSAVRLDRRRKRIDAELSGGRGRRGQHRRRADTSGEQGGGACAIHVITLVNESASTVPPRLSRLQHNSIAALTAGPWALFGPSPVRFPIDPYVGSSAGPIPRPRGRVAPLAAFAAHTSQLSDPMGRRRRVSGGSLSGRGGRIRRVDWDGREEVIMYCIHRQPLVAAVRAIVHTVVIVAVMVVGVAGTFGMFEMFGGVVHASEGIASEASESEGIAIEGMTPGCSAGAGERHRLRVRLVPASRSRHDRDRADGSRGAVE